jgi:hypothetical protein
MNEKEIFENLTYNLTQKDRAHKIKVRLLSANKNIIRKTPDVNGAVQQYLRLSTSHYNISNVTHQSQNNP